MLKHALIILGFIFAAVSGCLFYGFFIEPKRLVVREVSIPANIRAPLKLAFFADLHAGDGTVGRDSVSEVRDAIDGFDPDLVLFAGDFIDGHEPAGRRSSAERQRLAKAVSPLKDLSVPNGRFAVLGNHDHWYGETDSTRLVEELGFELLENTVSHVGELCIAGLSDEWETRPDLDTLSLCREGTYRLVLAHNPDTILSLREPFDLALAGHTHGGQINLPLIGRAVTSTRAGKRHAYGLSSTRNGPMFVTAGIGTSILPARFRAPPEVVLIELIPD